MTILCQNILETKKRPQEWTKSLIIPLHKKGNLWQCQNYKIISLFSHSSKVMINVILKRLKNKAEEHLAEEQAGFRPSWSTVEQIFTCQIMMKKHLQHRKELFHNFIDFKKAFHRVWHALCIFGIEESLVLIMKSLHSSAHSAILLNNSISEDFKTTAYIHHGCPLSPALFNLYLENIMRETLHNVRPQSPLEDEQ